MLHVVDIHIPLHAMQAHDAHYFKSIPLHALRAYDAVSLQALQTCDDLLCLCTYCGPTML